MGTSNLGSLAARGATTTLAIQGARFVLQLAGIVLLGRVLLPSDFGLIVMVAAVVGIGEVLRDFGLMAAAVQAKTLSVGQSNILFWLNTLIGFVLSIICFGIAPLVAMFYEDPRLTSIAYVLASTFLINGLQTQFQAHMTRELRFAALGISDLLSQFVGLSVALVGAVMGYGYWALAAQLLVQPLTLLVVRAKISEWKPGTGFAGENVRSELRFGGNLMLTQMMVYMSSNIDSVLIGQRFGAGAAGLYNRAFQVLMMPLNQVFAPATSVALPVLSRLANDSDRYNRFLQRGQRLIIYPALMLFASLASVAHPLFTLAFGEVWSASAELFQWLAIGGAFQAASYIGYWIFLSKGLTGSHFRYSLITRWLLIGLVCLGSFASVEWVAIAYSFGLCVSWPFSLLWLRSVAGIKAAPLFWISFRAMSSGLVAFLSGSVVCALAENWGVLLQCVIGVVTTLLMFVFFSPLTKAGRYDFGQIRQTAQLIRREELQNSS